MKNKILDAVKGVVNEFNGTRDAVDCVGTLALELFATALVSLPEEVWKRCADDFVMVAQKRAGILKSSGAVKVSWWNLQ